MPASIYDASFEVLVRELLPGDVEGAALPATSHRLYSG